MVNQERTKAVNRKNMKRIYLIKKISPWMLDEIEAFESIIDFDVILLRKPEKLYYKKIMDLLAKKRITFHCNQGIENISIKKLAFVIRFALANLHRFIFGYNAVISWTSLIFFLKLDLSVCNGPCSIHSQFATQASVVALMLKKFKKKDIEYSLTFHAHDIYFKNLWFAKLVNESICSYSISMYNKKYVSSKYSGINKRKIEISRLGTFEPGKKGNENKSKEGFTIGLLSWFVPKKGIFIFLDSMKTLQNKIKIRALLAGDGPLKREVLDYIKKQRITCVEYVGAIYGMKKEEFYRKLDIFILPCIRVGSQMDGIPVVLMEALSYSIPIITTNISGISEICIDKYNGFIVGENNSSEISECVLRIFHNEKLFKTMKKNSYKVFKQYNIVQNSIEKLKMLDWV